MSSFLFSKDLRLYLYGINKYSEELAKSLNRDGYKVCGFVDKRFSEFPNGFIGIPVFDLKSIKFDNNTCVIIMLQNTLLHDEIVRNLKSYGATNIIYVPFSSICGVKELELMNYYNDLVFTKSFYNARLPKFQNISKYKTKVIELKNDNYIVYVPFNMIYTSLREGIFSDKPILSFTPYRELFNYLFGIESSANSYLQRYGVNSCNYSNEYNDDYILKLRKQIFDKWELHYFFNDGYFDSGAPCAFWNENGKYFNLLEGQHRVLYLILKESIFIPVRLDKNSFENSIACIEKMIDSKSITEWKNTLKKEIDRVY